MVPADVPVDGVIVVAAFRAADLRRLHSLLCCYESPFVTEAEAAERAADVEEVERLRRYVRGLLDDLPSAAVFMRLD